MEEEKYYYPNKNDNHKPLAIIIGVDYDVQRDFQHSLDELEGLVTACDMECVGILTQSLPHPDNATYLGSGKVSELTDYVDTLKAEYCICEGDLTPSQMKNLQDIIKIPVWDRTNLILEIFSRRAQTRESKLQVETAYLQFMLPRLTGLWQHLGRQGGGGSHNKGEGEKQIELDKRYINHRIVELTKELDNITRTRNIQRDGRNKGFLPNVALVGYTNAGKSSLMNRLLGISGNSKEVFEKDMLFATLDTSIRKVKCKDNKEFLLSDTVGFIENLPHSLVKAFRSTLDEVRYADLLLIVLDSSDPYYLNHKKVTEETLKELEAEAIPRIYVFNKVDLIKERTSDADSPSLSVIPSPDRVYISTMTGEGIDGLLDKIFGVVFKNNKIIDALIPYSKAELLNRLHTYANVLSEEYTPDGIAVSVDCPPQLIDELSAYNQI